MKSLLFCISIYRFQDPKETELPFSNKDIRDARNKKCKLLRIALCRGRGLSVFG